MELEPWDLGTGGQAALTQTGSIGPGLAWPPISPPLPHCYTTADMAWHVHTPSLPAFAVACLPHLTPTTTIACLPACLLPCAFLPSRDTTDLDLAFACCLCCLCLAFCMPAYPPPTHACWCSCMPVLCAFLYLLPCMPVCTMCACACAFLPSCLCPSACACLPAWSQSVSGNRFCLLSLLSTLCLYLG